MSGYLFDPATVARSLAMNPADSGAALTSAWILRHGREALADLPGDFAISHWDPGARRLTLAVAPMAGQTLYWHRAGGIVSFATTVAALHRIPHVPRALDPLQLTAYFTAMTGDPTRSLYQDIDFLPPGQMLIIDAQACRRTVLWQPDLNRRLRLKSDGDYIEAARELLDRAVANRLRTAQSPAFLASGGLDSAAMLSSAARQGGDQPIDSYTVIPPPELSVTPEKGWYASEQSKVDALAARYPALRPTFCHASQPAAFETDPTRLFLTTGLPCISTANIGWFSSAHRAIQNRGHDVVVIGSMGNFTLSYDGQRCFLDLLRQGRLATIARLLPQVAAFRGRRSWDIIRSNMIMPMIPDRWVNSIRRYRHARHPLAQFALVRSDWLDAIGIEAYLAASDQGLTSSVGGGSRHLIAHFSLKRRVTMLPHQALVQSLYGFQIRDVFADRDLLEFCLAIPREQFVLDGRTRSLARRLLKDHAPDCIVNEARSGQQNPDWYFRMGPQRDAFAADIDSFRHHPLLAEMMDLPRMRRLLDDWPAEGEPHGHLRLDYPIALSRAIHMGRFVRWATGSNQ